MTFLTGDEYIVSPRKGRWIEIKNKVNIPKDQAVSPRKGRWIEISSPIWQIY